MSNARAMLTNGIRNDSLGRNLITACRQCGIDLALNGYSNYMKQLNSTDNAITWGMRLPHSAYVNRGRNVLFIENGLMRQSSGVSIDSNGYFAENSISVDKEWERKPTKQEVGELSTKIRKRFGYDAFNGGDPSGPLLVAWQTPKDAPMRYYYPLGEGFDDKNVRTMELVRHHLKDCGRKILFRPHPREANGFNRADWAEYIEMGWKPAVGGNVCSILKSCSGLITVNSTLVHEALSLGIPVATLGQSMWSGSDVTLECWNKPERLSKILKWKPTKKRVMGYLCAILRHELSYKASVEDIMANESFKLWVENFKQVTVQHSVIPSAPKREAIKSVRGPFSETILEQLAQAGLKMNIMKETDHQLPVENFDGAMPAPLERVINGSKKQITLGFCGMNHMGDALCISSLPRKLTETYGAEVKMIRHHSARLAHANNPYVKGFATKHAVPLGLRQLGQIGWGHHIHAVERYMRVPLDKYPRPEIYLSDEEQEWAQGIQAQHEKPILVLSPNVMTRTGQTPFGTWNWQRWVDVLKNEYTVIQPVITKMSHYKKQAAVHPRDVQRFEAHTEYDCEILRDIPARHYMALFSVAQGYLGTHAAGSHVAAAFDVPALVCSGEIGLPAIYPTPSSVHHLHRWLYPQHIWAKGEASQEVPWIFMGMKRSGHHAIVNWACKSLDQPITFHNNPNCNVSGNVGSGKVQKFKGGGAYHSYNFEDMNMDDWDAVKNSARYKAAKQVLIIRDPYNWAASCLNRTRTTTKHAELDVARNIKERMELWKQHARIALNPPDDLIIINYNRWFSDPEYRIKLSKQMEIPATDAGLNDVPRYGSGSSFEKRRFDGSAQDMKVLERYKEWENETEFQNLMDDEVHELAKQLFNMEV